MGSMIESNYFWTDVIFSFGFTPYALIDMENFKAAHIFGDTPTTQIAFDHDSFDANQLRDWMEVDRALISWIGRKVLPEVTDLDWSMIK